MQFLRLFALMGLIFGLVLIPTVPAPAQKMGKKVQSKTLSDGKQRKGKEQVIHQNNGFLPNVTTCPVKTPITPGQTVNGTLTTSDCQLDPGTPEFSYYDEYTFSATAGQTLSIAMSSAVFDTFLILLNPDNTIAAFNDDIDFPDNTNSRIPISGTITVNQTGTYAILANGYDSSDVGPYSLTLTFGGAGSTCPPTPTPISNGQTINGTFASGDCALGDNSRYHLYSFSAIAGQQVSISMTGTAPVDPYLFLDAPSGDTIALDDNGGGGTAARIPPMASTFGSLPETGTYTIVANTALGNQFGNYSLTLNFSGSTCPTTGISLGQTINGTLSAGDCRLPIDASLFDAYTFSGMAGQQIGIAQTSSDFDPFLFLLAPNGTVLAVDNNSGGGTNARIPGPTGGFTLPSTGTYTILANSNLPAGSGNYTLALSQANIAATIQLTFNAYASGEGGGAVSVGITRTGDITLPASVDYATSDPSGLNNCSVISGNASSRCDYTTAVGRARLGVGESTRNVSIPLVDDSYAEGNETFTFTLSNAMGATLGGLNTATVTIQDNEAMNGPNPIDGTAFFVRQQYLDFLGREPDPPGFAAWQAVINGCAPGDITCDRIHVSSSFFRSPEFQERGYFVYRFYPTAFGRKPLYSEFVPDLAKVSGFLSPAELEAAKVAFVAEFMTRSEFTMKFNGTTDAQYVDLLLSTAGITHPARDFWVAALGNATRTRAQVLREIAESTQVYNKYYNQAFVVMQYFGYLRREPDALYQTWITTLDGLCGVGQPCANPDDYRGMINGFMNSIEYRIRFGP